MNGFEAKPFNKDLMLVKALSLDNYLVEGFYVLDNNRPAIHNGEKIININPYAVCRNSGIKDKKNHYVFEYDLLKLKRFGYDDGYGYLIWDDFWGKWIIRRYTEYGGSIDIKGYVTFERVGNIILSDEDAQKIYDQDEKEKSREYFIDNSYCPSKFKK